MENNLDQWIFLSRLSLAYFDIVLIKQYSLIYALPFHLSIGSCATEFKSL
jgi:hypothetical protein